MSVDGAKTEIARGPIFVERADESRIQIKSIVVPLNIESTISAVNICFAAGTFPMEIIVRVAER